MIAPRHLSNAPITEALIDIQVKLPPGVDHTNFASVRDEISKEYPKSTERLAQEFEIAFKSGKVAVPSSKRRTLGYILRSADEKQVVQFRVDGFTFSRLRPYETWEQLRDEARRLWQLYVKVASSGSITRVALRYINHVNVPLPIEDFGDYMTAPPPLPEALPQGLTSFLTRVVIHEPSLDAVAVITQGLETIVKPDSVPIILDIDAFKVAEFDLQSTEAWDILEQLRVFKNKIFFESITEKTVGLFQ